MDQGQVESVESFEFRFVEDEAPRLVGGKTISMPVADLAAVRAGDHSALVRSLLALAASWFESAGSSIAFPCPATEIANHGNSTGTGILAAAVDLRKLLCASPQAREILRELGLDRYLADVEPFPAAEPKQCTRGPAINCHYIAASSPLSICEQCRAPVNSAGHCPGMSVEAQSTAARRCAAPVAG